MKDSIKPILKVKNTLISKITIDKTNVKLYDQGYTYDESEMSYDEVGVAYGGVYGHDIQLIKSIIFNTNPVVVVGKTNAQLHDQGITYNESGLTYDEVGYAYGGVYGHDIQKIMSIASNKKPTTIYFTDAGGIQVSHGTVVLEKGMLIGILGLTYAESGTITF
jgi:hypothetical protein